MEVNNNACEGAAMAQPPEAAPALHRELHVTIRLLTGGREVSFKEPANAPLLEILLDGARHLGVTLLPPSPAAPLDRLHDFGRHGHVGPAIDDIGQALGAYLKEPGTTPDFGIELVLAFRVNTRWAVATAPQMTPKEILALPAINLPYQEYTLYLPGSNNPLPLNQPITLHRGEALEAQRDGKYGMEG